MVNSLSTRVNPMSLPLGILSPPPNAMPNILANGSIGLVCLTYNPKRSCVQGEHKYVPIIHIPLAFTACCSSIPTVKELSTVGL